MRQTPKPRMLMYSFRIHSLSDAFGPIYKHYPASDRAWSWGSFRGDRFTKTGVLVEWFIWIFRRENYSGLVFLRLIIVNGNNITHSRGSSVFNELCTVRILRGKWVSFVYVNAMCEVFSDWITHTGSNGLTDPIYLNYPRVNLKINPFLRY